MLGLGCGACSVSALCVGNNDLSVRKCERCGRLWITVELRSLRGEWGRVTNHVDIDIPKTPPCCLEDACGQGLCGACVAETIF